MKRILPAVLAGVVLVLAACSSSTGIDGTCVAAVNVDGVLFGLSGDPGPDAATVSPEPYLEVTRRTGCLDQGEPGGELAPGESNFLQVGATLHRIDGFGPGERLAVEGEADGEWRALEPLALTP